MTQINSLQDAKEFVAKKYGYECWSAIALKCDRTYDDEAAELWAKACAEKAWDASLEKLRDTAKPDYDDHNKVYVINDDFIDQIKQQNPYKP